MRFVPRSLVISCVAVALTAALAVLPPVGAAAKEPASPTAPADELAKLLARHQELLQDIDRLRTEFQTADAARGREIQAEFAGIVRELQEEVQPKLVEVAKVVFEQDPTHEEAGGILLSSYYGENRYKEAAQVADRMLVVRPDDAVALNLGGIAHFAVHDFEKAGQLLTAARDQGGPIFQQLGARYLPQCAKYVELWKKEQQIRAREAAADDLPRVVLKTNRGEIVLELFENEAPNTVANFISLVEKDFYNGTRFHRVIANFMAQGGDPNTLDDDPSNDGTGGPGYTIACECYQPNARMHFQGSLSMAHAGKDTGGSQFFLTHLPTAHLNPDPSGPTGHTVFGRIIKGLDVALALKQGDRIESAEVLRKRNHPYGPKKN